MSDAQTLFSNLEAQYKLPSGLLDSVWATESGRGQNMLSPAGAQGHFQFMPGTAAQYGVTNPYDLTQSATGAAKYFSDLLKWSGGNLNQALAGYNWGQGNYERNSQGGTKLPTETRNYIQQVNSLMNQGGGATGSGGSAPREGMGTSTGNSLFNTIFGGVDVTGGAMQTTDQIGGADAAAAQGGGANAFTDGIGGVAGWIQSRMGDFAIIVLGIVVVGVAIITVPQVRSAATKFATKGAA